MTQAIPAKACLVRLNEEFCQVLAPDKHGMSPPLISLFFTAHGEAITRAVASLEGYKLIFSVPPGGDVSRIVSNGLLFADLVVLNHAEPSFGIKDTVCFFPIPKRFIERRATFPELADLQTLPYLELGETKVEMMNPHDLKDPSKSSVNVVGAFTMLPTDIGEWCLGAGRSLLSTGLVTYCPVIPPPVWEQYLYTRGINFQSIYKTYRLLPDSNSYLDENVARSIQEIDLPMMNNVDLVTLQKIKEDERESFSRFRHHMIEAINELDLATSSDSFQRQMDRMNEHIRAGIEEVRRVHRKLKAMRFIDLNRIVFIGLPTVVSAFVDSPAVRLLGPTLSISEAIKQYLDHRAETLKGQDEMRANPMYLLWRVFHERARSDDHV